MSMRSKTKMLWSREMNKKMKDFVAPALSHDYCAVTEKSYIK